jgi:hypothetical protein
MLRCLHRAPAPSGVRCQLRFAGGGIRGPMDHTASFTRALTPEEKKMVDAQANRTVAGFVPGKMFIRHWMATNMNSLSIANRGFTVLAVTGGILYGGLYFASAAPAVTPMHFIMAATVATFAPMHTMNPGLFGFLWALVAVSMFVGLH